MLFPILPALILFYILKTDSMYCKTPCENNNTNDGIVEGAYDDKETITNELNIKSVQFFCHIVFPYSSINTGRIFNLHNYFIKGHSTFLSRQ